MLQYRFNSLCSIELMSEERTTRSLKGVARFYLRLFRHLNSKRLVSQKKTNAILYQFAYYFKGLTSFYSHIPISTLGYAKTDLPSLLKLLKNI